MAWWWSWLLCIVGVFGMIVVVNKKRWGFLIGVGNEAVWLAYAFESRQLGFVPFALIYAVVYVRNWLHWGNE